MSEGGNEGAPVNLRLAAEQYARLGLLVFPLAPRSKTPLTPRGLHDATDDLEQIRAWWTQWPNANIGIVCGHMSGLFVIDIDGEEGEESIRALQIAYGELPASPIVLTGKGRHLWFRWYPGARNTASKLGPRIDTRGEGGYVVAPPSVHPSGARYTWAPGSSPFDSWAQVPQWIYDALERKPAPEREASAWQPSSGREADRARRYCLGALQRTHAELAAAFQGTRNERLRDAAYSLGGYVHTGHLSESEIRDALIDACRVNGSWQTEEHKCRDTLARSLAAGVASPREIPAPRPFERAAPPEAPPDSTPHPADEWTQPEGDTRSPAEVVPMAAPPPPSRKWKTTIERVESLESDGEALPTFLAALDEWTRGGLRRAKLVGIAGPPGAGKTSLALQLGHVYHDLGHPVAIYAADEDWRGLLIRWGQQCGLTREDIEAAKPETKQTLAWHVRKDLLDLVDPSEAGIDVVGAWLLHRSAELGKTGVLVVDSLQTCRVTDDEGIEPKRRVDRVVGALKSLAKAGLLVLVTSEVSRAFYRSQVDRIDPLAAFKESGSIEYALDLGLVLESVKGESGQVDVYIAKNRSGRTDRNEPATRLRLDFDRVTLMEIARPDPEPESATREEDDAEKVARMGAALCRALRDSHTPIVTQRSLFALVRGRYQIKIAAMVLLQKQGRITGGDGRPYLVSIPTMDNYTSDSEEGDDDDHM